MSARLSLEGGARGPDSKELQIRCREAFREFLKNCGYAGRMPLLVSCGSRAAAFEDFKKALTGKAAGDYVAMWIDSEDPPIDPEAAWEHLKRRDGWDRPAGATDDQVLLMTTCMETWIAADRSALKDHYGAGLQHSALPPLVKLECRRPRDVQDRLIRATRSCANAYAKGKRSYEIFAKLNPGTLEIHLPSVVRARRILNSKLTAR